MALIANYTANNILHDMQNAGCSCGAEGGSNTSPEEFLGLAVVGYSDNWPHPTSQMVWSDPVQQFDNIGLWVYTDSTSTLTTYQDIGDSEDSSGSTPVPQPLVQHFHGRCLLIVSGQTNGLPWSGYTQAIDQYCT